MVGYGVRILALSRIHLSIVNGIGNPSRLFKEVGNCLGAEASNLNPPFFIPWRNFAARKGTRTRKEKGRVKKVVEKKEFVFKNIQKLLDMPYKKQRPFDDSHYTTAIDDVFFLYKFRTKVWPFSEAIQNFRETHHPTVYNIPNAPVVLRVNVDLVYPNRPNKFMDGWRAVIEMKKPFVLPGIVQPSVLAFCIEDNDFISEVLKMGADLAGSKELIKAIQEGEVNHNDYEYIVAHPNIVPDLTAIRGLIKRKFPTVKTRTVSVDVGSEVKRLKGGIKLRLEKNDREPDFGFLETPIGSLDMSTEDLEGNFSAILKDTIPRRVSGKAPEQFIVSCILKTPDSSPETFKIDISSYLQTFGNLSKSKDKMKEVEGDLIESDTPVAVSATQ